MRYMNWDVLIFPETGDTKTPFQEFTTACTVIQDPGKSCIFIKSINHANESKDPDNATLPMPAHSSYFKPVTHPLPTVSCFVPSLLPGTPFKVSLHSWATPVASRATQAMAAQGNKTWFEAKVLLDGVCAAGILFAQDSSWPQVIDVGLSVDQDGKHEQLLFPPFHPELLTQVWANPAQGMGTVRVVIAEGINQGQAESVVFVKLRNIVTFSFQHAPLHILEDCGIAWPNPGMWWQGQQQFHNHNFPSPRTEPADPEAHGHSPRRQQGPEETVGARPEIVMAPPHMSQEPIAHPAFKAHGSHNANSPFWSQREPMHDPFAGASTLNSFYNTVATHNNTNNTRPGETCAIDHSRATSSSHDQSMPDYSRPLSPASSRHSYQIPDDSRPPTFPGSRHASGFANPAMNENGLSRLESMLQSHQEHEVESQFNDMMASFSPRTNSNTSGISAPSNTRVNSAANTPPLQSRMTFAAAQDRVSSYSGHPRSVSVTTRDPPPLAFQVSQGGTKPLLDFAAGTHAGSEGNAGDKKSQSETIIKKAPAGKPKGRKEGRTSELGGNDIPVNKAQKRGTTGMSSAQGKENNATSDGNISDGKRKRASNAAGPKIALEDRFVNHANSSPTRKVSKIGPRESPSKGLDDLVDLTAEGVVARTPLGELENRM